MNLLLTTTCGTSLLTNGASEADRKWLSAIANRRRADLDPADAQRLDQVQIARRKQLATATEADRRRLSAELNGIGAVLARFSSKRVQHLLIHTDTAAGAVAADLVATALRLDQAEVELLTAGGLRTDDPAAFKEALAELTREIEERVPAYRERRWFTVFNLTGGFKSINAYLQALGMLHADRCVFLFEGATDLMEIPRLPVRLADADEVRVHLTVFRRLANGYAVLAEDAAGVPDALTLEDDGRASTSVWGDVVWQRVRKALLAERLLEPLSAKVTYLPAVKKAFDEATAEHKVQVNEAIDAFSAHLDGVRPLLKSRTFKKLEGQPVPGATHELYAWSDGATGRLFGHYHDGGFKFVALGGHL